MQRLLSIALLATVALFPAVANANADVVTMINGDRLTGEVKSLERGKLRFDSSATGTIPIEWDEVASLTSEQNVQVETETGERHLGRLTFASREREIVVATPDGPIELEMTDVVFMTPIERRGLDRIDADVTFGYSFAKASKVQQLNIGLDVEGRTERRIFGLEADVVQSDSEDSDSSERKSLDVQYTRLRGNRWATGAVVRLDSNDELGLDLRTSVGAGAGRYVIQSNAMTMLLAGGVQVSRENVSSGLEDEDTVEGFLTMNWDWFRYDSPELDLSSGLIIFPNLTDTGRVRAEFDIRFRWELVTDLFWEVSFYDSYDSDPVVEGAEKNDYGIVTSLGYEF